MRPPHCNYRFDGNIFVTRILVLVYILILYESGLQIANMLNIFLLKGLGIYTITFLFYFILFIFVL